jgi:hypothetical protein
MARGTFIHGNYGRYSIPGRRAPSGGQIQEREGSLSNYGVRAWEENILVT